MGNERTPVLDVLGPSFPAFDSRTVAGTATLDLPDRPESVRSARDFTRSTLRFWRLSEQFDSVSLVVSELVTNALRYGDPAIELELVRGSRRLVCAVRDAGATAPCRTEADPGAESGRGLHLVECFSDGWGWRHQTESGGKVVWAVFRI
ncbi:MULTISPECIES: ATP-binding protein [unclassified Streptomyces]|jgi:anti-sigma regulatory factor (Ser/Thr protein kinase)|uniref:ATP-binding protein n=1 Tax=unclassified Streptomyces TaxID=2593676 RepID=UPI001904A551|nr:MULTISPECIES: ATP-binding protein [unclassified Streptomyces]MCU4748148.1 ATP-binding protein [Streptomyces sp. G-5]QQN78739.1 ATP-binding protein [Streptomyces sp. XC 2026]